MLSMQKCRVDIAVLLFVLIVRHHAYGRECPLSYTEDASGVRCVRIITIATSWIDASYRCGNGGHLLTGIGDDVLSMLKSIPDEFDTFWIGLSDRQEEGLYSWINDSSVVVDELNWHGGKAPISDDFEDCVAMNRNGQWTVLPCNTARAFICEKDFADKPFIPSSAKCAQSFYTSKYKDKVCFRQFNKKKNWFDARDFCTNIGGQLAHIDSYHYLDRISASTATSESYWIDLSDIQTEGDFRHLDESASSQTLPWGKGEPRTGNNMHCVFIYSGDAYFFVQDCNVEMKFVCEYRDQYDVQTPTTNPTTTKAITTPLLTTTCLQDTTTETGCQIGWIYYKERQICIQLNSGQKIRWSVSRERCKDQGADLVAIRDKPTLDFVQNVLPKNSRFWIGLHNSGPNTAFKWLDETEETNFTAWIKPPSWHSNVLCAQIVQKRDGLWADKSCLGKQDYICERPVGV